MRAHWLTHPEWVAASMSALAMYGCRYFVDEADTFVVRAERRRARTPLQVSSIGFGTSVGRGVRDSGPAVRASTSFDPASIETVLIDDIAPGLRLLTPELTLVTAAASAFRGAVWWPTPSIPGLPPGIVRAVQVADVAGGFLGVDPADALTSEILLRFRREARHSIASLSDVGADSPPETTLRLLASLVLPTAVTQIRIDGVGSS
ncbi:hypothetical protein [uncultured Corynebacterium sp.]|uniref:hypothetical protein n=1 Tax=uncultured Corynebacterium sp. TaxID=159447 RepID=UPI0025ED8807|nr:hypothetical protein [uncultured Corynebacterium sp.]